MATSTVERMFDDLLNLEVNLIVKSNMTARKMPMTGEAFNDIATQYDAYLVAHAPRVGVDLPAREVGDTRSDGSYAVEAGDFQRLYETAMRLAGAAVATRASGDNDLPEGVDVILKRIARNCEQLERIMLEREIDAVKRTTEKSGQSFAQWEPIEFEEKEDLLVLRKAWEVGTETVVMQTVAQVDGDIVTRLQPSRAGEDDTALHDAHGQLVSLSLEHWRFLFATVATFTLEVFRSFFPK